MGWDITNKRKKDSHHYDYKFSITHYIQLEPYPGN